MLEFLSVVLLWIIVSDLRDRHGSLRRTIVLALGTGARVGYKAWLGYGEACGLVERVACFILYPILILGSRDDLIRHAEAAYRGNLMQERGQATTRGHVAANEGQDRNTREEPRRTRRHTSQDQTDPDFPI